MDDIDIYISRICEGDGAVDVLLFEEIKELIYAKYGKNSQYINSHVIEHINREIEQLDKYEVNQDINNKNKDVLIQYIMGILGDNDHPLQVYMKEAILQDSVITVWGDNGSQILSINGLISNIILSFKKLQAINDDEKMIIVKKRDKHKIDDAISLIKMISDDVHLLHHLNNIKHKPIITKTKILSSMFYQFTKCLENDFYFNKSQIEKYANDIMTQVFDSKKDYRIYKNSEDFRYKGFYLTRYIP